MADVLTRLVDNQAKLLDVYNRKWALVEKKIGDAQESIDAKTKHSLLLIEESIALLDKDDAIQAIKEARNDALEEILQIKEEIVEHTKSELSKFEKKLSVEVENLKKTIEAESKKVSTITALKLDDDVTLENENLLCFGAECVQGTLTAVDGHLIDIKGGI